MNVFITATGKWLLGGFGYSTGNQEAGQLAQCAFSFTTDLTSQMSTDPSLKYESKLIWQY